MKDMKIDPPLSNLYASNVKQHLVQSYVKRNDVIR